MLAVVGAIETFSTITTLLSWHTHICYLEKPLLVRERHTGDCSSVSPLILATTTYASGCGNGEGEDEGRGVVVPFGAIMPAPPGPTSVWESPTLFAELGGGR